MPDTDRPDHDRVDEVIAEYLKAVGAGKAPSREALIARHSDLADQLLEFFADKALFDRLTDPLRTFVSSVGDVPLSPAELPTEHPDDTPGTTAETSEAAFGDYRSLEEIARGGMGIVYKAFQVSLNRPVALKMILAGRLASTDEVRRFQVEAEAAAQLDHANIVSIYEVGQHDGRPYFSMPLVEGGDLTEQAARFTEDYRATARFMAAVARAVHHAHQRGILHRDLKPRNILIDGEGQPQITDFGLAKRIEQSSGLTHSGAILGTASYMAPEQARADKVVTVAVDVYSLGAILYELLTGRPPFQGTTPAGTMLMLLDGEPLRPRLVNPKIPRDMQTICLKCLEKDASKRYSSAASLAEDLESWLNGRPISARPVSSLERAWRWCRRNPTLAAVPAVALAIIVLLTGFYYRQLVSKNRETRRSHDRTQDALARSLYEQARATRVSGELGRRWEVFRLLGKAEALRGREREFPIAPPLSDGSVELESLPSIADLRSEAIAASLLIDARMSWEWSPASGAQPALSCDGRLAAVLWRGEQPEQPSVAIIDTANRGTPRQFNNQEIVGTAFALSPDGNTLASFVQQGAEKINLWSLTDGRRIAELDWPELPGLHDQPPAPGLLLSSEMSFSPDGRYLTAVYRLSLPINAKLDGFEEIFATSTDDQDRGTSMLGETIQTIVLWDIEGNAAPQNLATTLQNTDRGAAVFSPNGTLVGFAAGERTVRLRNLQSECEPMEVQLPLPLVGKLAFDTDGRWLVCPCRSSTARRGAVVVWDLTEDRERMRLDTDFSLTAATSALSPDGDHLALGTRSGRIVLFHLARRKMVVDIKAAHRATVAILRWSTNSRHLLSWGIQGTLKRWQLAERSVSDGQSVDEVFGFALSPDAQWLAYGGGPKGQVQLVDRRTGLVVRTLAGYEFPLPGLLLFSHDSRRLAQVGAYQAVVWDVMTGQEVTRLEERSGLTGRIGSVAFNNRGALLACVVRTNDPKLAVWDLIDRRAIWQPRKGKYDALHLTPDGRLLAGLCSSESAARRRVVVLEIPAGRAIGEIELAAAPIGPQTFTPEGRWLVTTDSARPGLEDVFGYFPNRAMPRTDTELNLQSFPAGAKRLKIVGPSVPTAFAVNPDGRLLAIGYQDGSVKLWGLTENEEILRADFCAQAVSQLAFMPDGRSLVITDGTSPVQFLDLSMVRRQLAEIGLDW